MSTLGSNALKDVGEAKPDTEELSKKIPRLKDRLTAELVIALVGPVGSGCTTTYETLRKICETDYSYSVHYYKLSQFILESAGLVDVTIGGNITAADRVAQLQNAGDALRHSFGGDYLAAKAIARIAQRRDSDGFGKAADGRPIPKRLRQIHIIDSIKHPDEIRLLRATYGEIFWLIGVFAPQGVREQRLSVQQSLETAALDEIMRRDYREEDEHGQKVRDVFHQADFFVRNDGENKANIENGLNRFIEIIFGSRVHTPTIDESSMYAAYAEAAKSACLSRQVGAAIVSSKGELIGHGRNDVPRYGGGLYTEDAGASDHRCHAWQDSRCHNDKRKDILYRQIYLRLTKESLLSPDARLEDVTNALKATDVKQLIEYSRAVHAETEAIISVARTNKPGVLGGTLYSTTFPCHSCARHIVASGIDRVIFIEPYPKSLAGELHSDAVSENEGDKGRKVLFLQFSGIAPKNILKLFHVGLTRKDSGGKLKTLDKKVAYPIVVVSLDDYSTHEKYVIAELNENEKKAARGRQATLFDA